MTGRSGLYKNTYGARKNKLGNSKVTFQGETFDSKKELQRWLYLRQLEKEGKISALERQVKFELIPAKKLNGRVVERACNYVADFVYIDWKDAMKVVEDVKGYRNPNSATYAKYVIKRKLMLHVYGIRIKEV